LTPIILSVSPRSPDGATVGRAVEILRGGGVIAFATDTFYGLAADPRRDDAVDRVFDAKGRPDSMPIPLVAADLPQAGGVAEFGEVELSLARHFWPGPLTIVAPARQGLAQRVLGPGSTIAVRVPAHEVARALCASFGHCLTATSANLTGKASPSAVPDIDPALAARIDAALDSGPAPGGPPSTIVTVASGRLQLIRAGAIAWDRVIKSLQ
jgi:L-threonylcarbamoyladenylate synthase